MTSQSLSACNSSLVILANFSIVTLNVFLLSLPPNNDVVGGAEFSLSSVREEGGGCFGGDSDGKRNISGDIVGGL